MNQARLNDAAIALYILFNGAGIKHGAFGGFAIGALGGPRETKDIDFLASVSKQEAITILDGKAGFTFADQSRDDYVAFVWSNHPKRERGVLVEIFPEKFQGARFGMQGISPVYLEVTGQASGPGYTAHLDPLHIFKGKLCAAAARPKYHDSADLRWLEQKYSSELQTHRGEFNLECVGLAMKRYPELESLFVRIGIDTNAAKVKTESINVQSIPTLQRGDVQMGLLASVEVSPFTHSMPLSMLSGLGESSGNNGKGKEKEATTIQVNVSKWIDKKQLTYEFEYNRQIYKKKASEWTRWTTGADGKKTEPWLSYLGKTTGITFWTVEASIVPKQVEVDVVWEQRSDDTFYEFQYNGNIVSKLRDLWEMTTDANQILYLTYDSKTTGIRFWTYPNLVKPKISTRR